MVAARTRHLDMQILEFVCSGGRDLVLLGAGYDMRPFRLSLPAGNAPFMSLISPPYWPTGSDGSTSSASRSRAT